MYGFLCLTASILSIIYPLHKTTNQLVSLQIFHDNKISLLTDTIPLSVEKVEELQELITYWIVLSIWLFIKQLSIVSFIIKLIPFSSLLCLYIQIWLAFPIIPIQSLQTKVSGSFLIYYYYFGNNMGNFNNLKIKLFSTVGYFGEYICQFINYIINKIPSLNILLKSFNIDFNFYEKYFNSMYNVSEQNEINKNTSTFSSSGIANTIFGTNINNDKKIEGITEYISSWAFSGTTNNKKPNLDNRQIIDNIDNIKTNSNSTYFLISSLFAPFGIKSNDSAVIETLTSTSISQSTLSKPPPKNSKNSSPTRSFDDFAIVSEKDLLDSSSDLSAKMYKSKRNNRSREFSKNSTNITNNNNNDYNDNTDSNRRSTSVASGLNIHGSRTASNISIGDTIYDETTGLLDNQSTSSRKSSVTGKKVSSRSGSKSSWFGKVRG